MLRHMNENISPLPPAARWRPSAATLLSLVAGVMLTSALPPVRGTALLAPLALAVFFSLLLRGERTGWLGLLFGVGYATALMNWLFFLDPAKSIPTRALVPVQAVAAILFVAVHFALFGWVVGRLQKRLGRWRMLALMPVLWTVLELIRSVGELAFPWGLVGSAWLNTPLSPLFAAAGELALGTATALLAALMVALAWWRQAEGADRRLVMGLAVATPLAWLLLVVGSQSVATETVDGHRTDDLLVAAVQADVSQADKWHEARLDSTRIPYTELTAMAAEQQADLVVWAETAIPGYVRFDRGLLDWVRSVARDNAVPIVTGFPDARIEPDPDGEDGRRVLKFNAAGVFSREGTLLDTYGKHHLVPIGESMPFQRYLPFLGGIDVGQAEWTRGAPPGPMKLPTLKGDVPVACLICFEAVFSELARGAVQRGATVLLNITNDGWFGPSAGPRQHAAMARIRAIECGVPVIRSANNGISMVIDQRGRVVDSLELNRRGMVMAPVSPVPRGTLYVRWGIWPVLVFLGVWLLVTAALHGPLRRKDTP